MGRPMGHTVRVGSSAPMNRDSIMRRHGTVSVVQRHKSFGQPQGGVGIAFEDRVGTCLLVKQAYTLAYMLTCFCACMRVN